ncbi:MAG: isoleucine--tRNA ligase [Geminicoccaceae bacterium]
MAKDYRDTVCLPQTSFPMKASLPTREPAILERWQAIDIYRKQREQSAGREPFILHDGPPYANGHLHMGHAVNKVLKDLVNRNQQMLGKNAIYVPGWDCHGLPIEWNIEQTYRKKGQNKDEVPVADFRKECRAYADKWVDVQSDEFQRLGVIGDWKRPWTTMRFDAEAGIFRELAKFLMDGSLYRGKRSVMWSVVEKTALAEAEVEYHDHTSHTIWVRFPVVSSPVPALDGASVVIWTTTPWTIPANRAVAYGEAIRYLAVEVEATAEGSFAKAGETLLVAEDLLAEVCETAKISQYAVTAELRGSELAGTVLAHPFQDRPGYGYEVPMLAGDFVTTEQGTGLVHVAPSHGADDFELGARHGLEVPDTVAEDGLYTDEVPGFEGIHVFKAHEPVIEALEAKGALLAKGKLVHSYPHSWRSRAPLIFRATPQWFIPMDGEKQLRKVALEAIAATRWVPPQGETRIRTMIENRPDWCVSRQRAWGVPIAVFVSKETGEVLRDPAVTDRIARAFEQEGADAWWTRDPQEFLGNGYSLDDFEKIDDILDVWFDSGSTHATVLEQRDDLSSPASLYLEGSDQHRGWFHSSLLESCGTRGRAPFEAVLTHGFVLDAEGRKMSKSLGNGILPSDVLPKYGADILRLWTASVDFSEDMRLGFESLNRQADAYRRLRNTLRFLLGNLHGFHDRECLEIDAMPELERWVLHRLQSQHELVVTCNQAFDFARLYNSLHNFCAVDLSAFYFDVRKDVLYCDPAHSIRRRACRTVLDRVFDHLVRWLAPVLVFTAEEAWLERHGDAGESVHLQDFLTVPSAWSDPELAKKWDRIREIRRVITGALEVERREKRIRSSLEAAPEVFVTGDDLALLADIDMAELAITSGVALSDKEPPDDSFRLDEVRGVAVLPRAAEGRKCQRCWQLFGELDADDLCERCADAVRARMAA